MDESANPSKKSERASGRQARDRARAVVGCAAPRLARPFAAARGAVVRQPSLDARRNGKECALDLASTLSLFHPKSISSGDRNVVRELWDVLSPLPGGKQLFSRAIGKAAPYTGTIGAKVEVLRRGYAEVRLIDRPSVRNHLRCIHAVALVNLAELTGNVALAYTLPDDARFIVAGISIEYLKKARGTIRGICESPLIESAEKREYAIEVSMRNISGEEVARATLRSLVGPKPRRGERE
jgi:acyl-coenzyme A thioesterase PaaI-like protein